MRILSDNKYPIKIWTDDIEPEALIQLKKLADMPFIHKHVAVMPDAHHGMGSTVGTVIATTGAIIPAAVGVDIGCGMCAVKMPFKIDVFGDSLESLRSAIEAVVPVGFNSNIQPNIRTELVSLRLGLTNKQTLQLGTLGGGNHFIEVCKDEDNNAWVMLHSGSRNMGKTLAESHIDKAKGLMKSYFIDLPNPDLAYLAQDTPEFDLYLHDLMRSQEYARENRNEMMIRVLREISLYLFNCDKGELAMTSFRVDCHHNFTQLENHFGKNIWITRKGAVSAREGQYGIIPGSMGAKSFIVKGKGNLESFCSCSHGAGRKMSRTQARKQFTLEDLAYQTNGVECRKDEGILDEIPGAYKSIDKVMKDQEDLVEIVHTLNQLICIKG